MFMSSSPSIFSYRVTDENKFKLTAKTSHFSDENIHFPGNSRRQLQENITLIIYGNGNCDENRGYVSVYFNVPPNHHFFGNPSIFEIRCIMSLIDVAGEQRYSRSFAASNHLRNEIDSLPSFGCNRFLERKKLLDEQSELLPNDTLTILFDIYALEHIFDSNIAYYSLNHFIWQSFKFEDGCWKLCLDSGLVLKFSEVSEYFRSLLRSVTVESRTRFMRLFDDEFRAFECLGWLVLSDSIREETVMFQLDLEDIFRLYNIAAEYFIPHAVEKCREFLKSIMSSDNNLRISEFARLFEDKDLEAAASNFQPSTEDFDLHYEGNRQVDNRKYPLLPIPLSDETVKTERSDLSFYE